MPPPILLGFLAWLLLGGAALAEPAGQPSATFSIVAADPETGTVGAAVASKFPKVGNFVPYVRAGVGAFCTQYWHNPAWGKRALDLLAAGRSPEAVLTELLDGDGLRERRQLGIVDAQGRTANWNPHGAQPDADYWGSMAGRDYAVQGNTLREREVIVAMAAAFEETAGSLADRLMASLVAGDCAGGDHRGRLAARIRVAKPGVKGDWLSLEVDRDRDAVIGLLRQYAELEHPAKGAWKGGRSPFVHPCEDRSPRVRRREN